MRADPADKKFEHPVFVRLESGELEIVSTVGKAAETLLYKWPGKDMSRKHLAARKACLRALEGLAEAKLAREAFTAAAEEAGALERMPRVITDFLPKKRR